jgi:hypothetical protein
MASSTGPLQIKQTFNNTTYKQVWNADTHSFDVEVESLTPRLRRPGNRITPLQFVPPTGDMFSTHSPQLLINRLTRAQVLLFRSKIAVSPTGCWIWQAAKSSSGYGVTGIGQNTGRGAHQVAYAHWVGPIFKGNQIHHRCGVEACSNPKHLEQVDQVWHKYLHRTRNASRAGMRAVAVKRNAVK